MSDLSHDPTTNNPPPEAVLPPPMPVAPDPTVIEAAIRGEHKSTLASWEEWIASVARAPAVIETEAQAAGYAKTISELIKARTGAEKLHAAIKGPWFNVTKAIDAIFLTGIKSRAEAGQKLLEQRQKVWITKKATEARLALEAETRRLEQEAETLRAAEAAALKSAERAMDEGDFDTASTMLAESAQHNEAAAEADQGAAQATDKADGKIAPLVRTHHAVGVTTSAKTFWNVELLSRTDLKPEDQLKFWNAMAPFMGPDVIQKAAKAAVKAGLRECPGLKIFEDFNPLNR